jgi:acetyl-CoA C-acetyltransferase
MRDVAIIGVGIHKFGRFEKSYTEIGADAIRMALKDAGIQWNQVEAAYAATASRELPLNAGPKVAQMLGRTGIGISGVDAACASGGVALNNGVNAVKSGSCDICVVFGVEKIPRGVLDPGPRYERWQIEMGLSTNFSYWSMSAVRHMHEYGTTELHLAKVAYKNHKYGLHNPYAMYQKEFTLEEILNSRMVCWPTRLLEICSPNEGAAAVVLCSAEKASRYTTKPVFVAASVHKLTMYSADLRAPIVQMSARVKNDNPAVVASRKAYEQAGVGPDDIDCAEVQDTDAFMELTHYEDLGFCKEGEAGKMIDSGATELGGKVPVNLSGGLICKGEPIGASHLGQVVFLVWQLREQLDAVQVNGARVALAQVTGAMGHTAVTILKK